MKYNSKQYVMALYEAARGKDESGAKKIIENFISILKINNDFSLAKKILKEFEVYAMEENGIFEGEIISARRMDEKTKMAIENKLADKKMLGIKIKEVTLKEKIDRELIGGFKVMINNFLIDASIQKALSSMKKRLVEELN